MSALALVKKEASPLEDIARQGRYSVGHLKGQGCWGQVYSAVDNFAGGEQVAIKILEPSEVAQTQMEERRLTPEEALKKEIVRMTPASNIVPRRFEVAGKTPFIVMPHYDQTLADVIDDAGERKSVANKKLSKEDVRSYALSLANGIVESHTKLRRAHGDLKADNIMVDGKNALLTDFGSSTTVSLNNSGNPRDNIGFLYTRAPELFQEGSRPNEKTDLWSWGALTYRMYSGSYPFEEELNKDVDFLKNATPSQYRKLLSKKLKKVPRKVRSDLEMALSHAVNLRHDMQMISKNYESSSKKSWLSRDPILSALVLSTAIGGTALLGVVGFNSYKDYNHQVTQQMETLEKKASKMPIMASWSGSSLEISNNLFTTDILVSEPGPIGTFRKRKTFPSKDYVVAKAGEEIDINVMPRFVIGGTDYETKMRLAHHLEGKVYLPGYEAKAFSVFPWPKDNTEVGEGYFGGDISGFKIPKDLADGIYTLIVETYAPKEAENEYSNLIFASPGKTLSLTPIYLVVGNVPVENRAVIQSLPWNTWGPQVINFANMTYESEFGSRSDLNSKLTYAARVPELDAVGEKHRTWGSALSLVLKNPEVSGNGILEFTAKDENGKIVSTSYLPVKHGQLKSYSKGYEWALDLPDETLSQRIIDFKNKYK